MKRLVISMCVVLLMAAVSNAATIDLRWAENDSKELTLNVSETATINVYAQLDPGETCIAAAWFLLCDEDGVVTPGPDPLDFEVIGYSSPLEAAGWIYDRSANSPLPIANMNEATGEFPAGVKKGLSDNILDGMFVGLPEGETLIADVEIHCVSISEDIIYFNEYSLYRPIFTDLMFVDYYPVAGDPLILHQIPEPATMALLGLGGLALLRKRR
jgi:hypothetical protein